MQFNVEIKLIRKNTTQNDNMKCHPKFLVAVEVGQLYKFSVNMVHPPDEKEKKAKFPKTMHYRQCRVHWATHKEVVKRLYTHAGVSIK